MGELPRLNDDESAAPTDQRVTLSGTTVGEYRVEKLIGQGAMGVVYQGIQPVIGRPVAIKVLRSGAAFGPGLLDEARAVTRARHPNIIDIFSFGELPDGAQYFVMELLSGETLEALLKRERFTVLETVQLLRQLLSGLAAAHSAEVLHRDLKPANLFLLKLHDGSSFLKILDFGLAKRFDLNAPPDVLQGLLAGTPLYMSPEQAMGLPTTTQSDLYAVGCIAYELLSGSPPFQSGNVTGLLLLQAREPAPPLVGDFPPSLVELVMSLLEKEPANRPSSAATAKQAIDSIERRLNAEQGTSVELPQLGPVVREHDDSASRPTEVAQTPIPVLASRRELGPAIRATDASMQARGTTTNVEVDALPAKRRWLFALVPLLLALGLTTWALWPEPKVELVVLPAVVTDEPEPPPPPVVPVVEPAPPPPAPPEVPALARPVRPKKSKLQVRFEKLDELVMLKLVEDRQKAALAELKVIHDQAAAVPAEKVNATLDAFETKWLTPAPAPAKK